MKRDGVFKITLVIVPDHNEALPTQQEMKELGEDIKDYIYDGFPVEDVTYEIEELPEYNFEKK